MTLLRRFHPHLVVATILLSFGTLGCTIRLVSEYDEATDKAVTALQRSVTSLLLDIDRSLSRPEESSYERFADRYASLRVDLSALRLRVDALPDNSITQQQVLLLSKNIDNLEELHRLGFAEGRESMRTVIRIVQKDFDTALGAILKLELAKRRGMKTTE